MTNVDHALQELRPVLISLAEALVSPVFRGHIDASDLVQQTMLEAHCNADILETLDERRLFGWLRTALKHNLLDAVKQLKTMKNDIARRVGEVDLEESFARLDNIVASDESSPSQIFLRNEQITLMLSSLQTLPTNQRMAVIMKHLRGHSLKEVAELLGVTQSAAAGLLHRGRQQLLRSMEKSGHG